MDEILKSLRLLKESQEEGQTTIKRRLNQLEKDVAVGQEDATQHVVKRLKEDQMFTFKKKGNKKQFIFNDNEKDQFVSTTKHLELVDVPSASGQQETIDKAKEELKQGLEMIAARQKRIKVVDCSEFGWATVDEYKQDQLAADEEDAKRLEKAEKSASSKAVKRVAAIEVTTEGDNKATQLSQSGDFQLLQLMGSCEEGSEPDQDLGRYWELEQDAHQVSDVQGRLLANINFWEQVLEVLQYIVDYIKEGYKLPLLSLPKPFKGHNHMSAFHHKKFVSQAISNLIHNRCVAKVEDTPPICSPLSVIVNNSGKNG